MKIQFSLQMGLIVVTIFILTHISRSESPPYVGSITGQITDVDTREPVFGANVILKGTEMGASSDLSGNFNISSVPIGSYVVQCSYLGYESVIIADVIVKPGRAATLRIELKVLPIQMEEITVTPSYFTKNDQQPTSVADLSYEEIRRGAGSGGDVSRVIMALPSVAKVNDTRNTLVVRGGSPMENGYYIDNIPIPNINHYPAQGASSGALSLVNLDFVSDVQFTSGGFSSLYGDKLSSITELSFREGNRERFESQLDFNLMGIGAIGEGPLLNQKGAWLFSARRSYMDFLLNAADVEASTIPEYGDLQGKVDVELSGRNKLTVIDIFGYDRSHIEKSRSLENQENTYGDWNSTSNVLGVDWKYLWGGRGYSTTSLSHSYTDWKNVWYRTLNDDISIQSKTAEQSLWLRNVNHFSINHQSTLDFGVEAQGISTDYDNYYGQFTDPLGNVNPAFGWKGDLRSAKAAVFTSYRFSPFDRLTLTTGLRLDYFDYNQKAHLSPRVSVAWALGSNTTLTGAYGQFSQSLPLILLSQQNDFKSLDDPLADHYVLGLSQILSENTRLTLEAYAKEYRNLPLDPNQPSLFVIDESADINGFSSHQQLIDRGRAYTRGVEVMLQKKLADKIYGIISGSYFRSRYQGYDGVWRNRIYDNRYMGIVEGGYKPNSKWEFSLRWIYAGGVPYTPFDLTASASARSGIYDQARINGERLPDYHSLNIRVDRRFYFRSWSMIAYLSIWNVYGRENIAGYYWDEVNNVPRKMKQWGVLPFFGLEIDF